jgi:hypothetical protein
MDVTEDSMKPAFHNLLAGITLLLICHGAFAQVFFNQPREFVLDHACAAYTSLKKKTTPQTLETGKTYTALGENKQPGATHAFLQLSGGNKWVELSCGHYTNGGTNSPNTNAGTAAAATGNAGCSPFFDNIDNPVKIKFGGTVDITPPLPPLNDFDRAVNNTCGSVGKIVPVEEFKALLRNNPAVLQRIMAFTQHRVYANRPARDSAEAYLQDLAEAWFTLKAFDHIMCGEPQSGGAIGGLHFIGRYVQLQQTGEACRMSNFRQNEVVPDVLYSMGAMMKAANGGEARSSIKGYGLTLSAEDILKTATRAFTENPTSSTESTACMLPVSDDGKNFTVVFVRRASGIRTFYPDATPSPTDPACASSISTL